MNDAPNPPRLSSHVGFAWEAIDQPLYDGRGFAKGDVVSDTLRFFEKPIGSAMRGGLVKTSVDTNMDLPCMLPKGKEFLVTGVRLHALGNDEDRMRLFWYGYFELLVGSKVYLKLPLAQLVERFDLHKATYILLVSEQNFCCELVWRRPFELVAPMRISLELRGFMYRRTA
jgi:hypothetical protein